MIRRPGYGDDLAATIDPDIHERQSGAQVPPGFADAIGWIAAVSANETPHWRVAFTVADRDETAAKAVDCGATVISTTDTDWTKEALIRDTQGAEFAASQYIPPAGWTRSTVGGSPNAATCFRDPMNVVISAICPSRTVRTSIANAV